ncbi:unnamed protein product [Ixodes pacificus]
MPPNLHRSHVQSNRIERDPPTQMFAEAIVVKSPCGALAQRTRSTLIAWGDLHCYVNKLREREAEKNLSSKLSREKEASWPSDVACEYTCARLASRARHSNTTPFYQIFPPCWSRLSGTPIQTQHTACCQLW